MRVRIPPLLVGFRVVYAFCGFFFFNDTATTEIYTLSLHDALPISEPRLRRAGRGTRGGRGVLSPHPGAVPVHDVRPRARDPPRLADVHGEFDGLREAAGAGPDAAGDLPGTERRQPVAAGRGGGDRDLPGRGARSVAPLSSLRGARPRVRRPADHPDRRGRHADGHLAPELLRRARGGGHGLRPGEQPPDHRRRAWRRLPGPPLPHHVPGDEPVLPPPPPRRLL